MLKSKEKIIKVKATFHAGNIVNNPHQYKNGNYWTFSHLTSISLALGKMHSPLAWPTIQPPFCWRDSIRFSDSVFHFPPCSVAAAAAGSAARRSEIQLVISVHGECGKLIKFMCAAAGTIKRNAGHNSRVCNSMNIDGGDRRAARILATLAPRADAS